MRGELRQVNTVLEEARAVADREAAKAGKPSVAKCRSCGTAVYWAVTGTGAAMPVTCEPRADGNISLRWNGTRVLAVYVDASFVGPRRVSHFADCPHAAQHRKGP